jgi:transcriptional regulator with XRE-family HTH domain
LRNPDGSRWTHAQLAEAVGVERNAVSRWENQGKTPRDSGTFARLAKVLHVTIDWLVTGHGSPGGIGYVREPTPQGAEPRARLAVSVKGARPRPFVYGRLLNYLEELERRGFEPEQIVEAEGMMLDFMYSELFPLPGKDRPDDVLIRYIDIMWDALNRAVAVAGIAMSRPPEGIQYAEGGSLEVTDEVAAAVRKADDEARAKKKIGRRRPGKG